MKFFIQINFYAKIVIIADLDYSADANFEMRQVLCVFPGSHGPSEESGKECLWEKSLGAPQGGPKVPPRPYAEKNFVSISGVQTTQNALTSIMCFSCISKSILRGPKRLLIRPSPLGPPWGPQNTLEALNRKICFKNGEFCRFRLIRQSQFGNQTNIMLFGQQLRQGTKSCRMGGNSVHPSIHPSVYLSVCPSVCPPPGPIGRPSGPSGWPPGPSA